MQWPARAPPPSPRDEAPTGRPIQVATSSLTVRRRGHVNLKKSEALGGCVWVDAAEHRSDVGGVAVGNPPISSEHSATLLLPSFDHTQASDEPFSPSTTTTRTNVYTLSFDHHNSNERIFSMPQHLSHHRLSSSAAEIRADLRNLARLAKSDLDAAEDAYIAFDPYIEHPGGGVYAFLQLCDDPALQQHQFVDVKIGKANDVAIRRLGHQRKCPGVQRIWAYFYPTSRPMLVGECLLTISCPRLSVEERLVHLHLNTMGARRPIHPCAKCVTNHQEFYSEELVSLEDVAELIEAKIRKIGDVAVCIPLFYDS
ncbi:hypothetical protein B0H14DRAFT_3517558 [Mycena olivaceomarginata]|nr:hypothetical protein B0H14DRAFT_3517558 [Mycena olivaceomarginata]